MTVQMPKYLSWNLAGLKEALKRQALQSAGAVNIPWNYEMHKF
jgi:hypothetical protein